MDISGLYDNYADYLSTTTATSESATKLDAALSSDKSDASDKELMDVCKQFESYFLEQIFKEMKKTIPEEDYSTAGMSTRMDFFEEQAIQELASQSTEQNQLGLAQSLFEQMKRNYDI
ncbi:MAG: rod-binding protein [Lachnospiraceae bacterium]|nr:rod-binding protein [Lachnospiraceae bacterium]